ncbi:MAG TPA: hypothetical protein VK184_07475 [Nostocaceae cyanobacterium]|nr:hypothetical protein [Nostocaceae cyanobacterium]
MNNRRWSVADFPSAEAIAEEICNKSLCLCTGFSLNFGSRILVLVNQSSSSDSSNFVQSYSVLTTALDGSGDFIEIEALCFWELELDKVSALISKMITKVENSDFSVISIIPKSLIQSPLIHGTCLHCD